MKIRDGIKLGIGVGIGYRIGLWLYRIGENYIYTLIDKDKKQSKYRDGEPRPNYSTYSERYRKH